MAVPDFWGSDMEYELRRYNQMKQKIETRPVNRGAEITDHLPTLKVDPDALNMWSEIEPVKELITGMANKFFLLTVLELPKCARYGKLYEYGLRALWSMAKMNSTQRVANLLVSRNRERDLGRLKQEIKEFAVSQGYISGFTRVDRRFISEARDEKMPYDTVLVLGMEMDRALLDQVPHPRDRLFDFDIYVKSGVRIFKVANFIRSKGYRCYVRVPFDAWVKYPPHAINAGLGELGAQGVVITPEYGPRQRWGMIGIDAEIEVDRPVDLGMAAYCDACGICIKACPGKAISETRVWWRGVFKHKINDTRCWPFFKKYDGCGICLKVCPINRQGYEACMDAFRSEGKILR